MWGVQLYLYKYTSSESRGATLTTSCLHNPMRICKIETNNISYLPLRINCYGRSSVTSLLISTILNFISSFLSNICLFLRKNIQSYSDYCSCHTECISVLQSALDVFSYLTLQGWRHRFCKILTVDFASFSHRVISSSSMSRHCHQKFDHALQYCFLQSFNSSSCFQILPFV